MNIATLRDSKFLKKEDCGAGILVTIAGLHEENLAMEGQAPEMGWCLTFAEQVKPMVLKSTNAQLIAQALGSDETDNWIGKKIVLFHDQTVQMGGKLVGGIRARAPRNQAPKPAPQFQSAPVNQPRPAPAPVPPSQVPCDEGEEVDDSQVPF